MNKTHNISYNVHNETYGPITDTLVAYVSAKHKNVWNFGGTVNQSSLPLLATNKINNFVVWSWNSGMNRNYKSRGTFQMLFFLFWACTGHRCHSLFDLLFSYCWWKKSEHHEYYNLFCLWFYSVILQETKAKTLRHTALDIRQQQRYGKASCSTV